MTDNSNKYLRQNGKTFRKVLRCVADASDGEHIILVSNTQPHADRAISFMHYVTAKVPLVSHRRSDIRFEGAGSLRILTGYEYRFKNKNGEFNGLKARFVFDS